MQKNLSHNMYQLHDYGISPTLISAFNSLIENDVDVELFEWKSKGQLQYNYYRICFSTREIYQTDEDCFDETGYPYVELLWKQSDNKEANWLIISARYQIEGDEPTKEEIQEFSTIMKIYSLYCIAAFSILS